MPIEGVNTISGRGTVVTGRVDRGVLKSGDTVEIIGLDNGGAEVTVTGTQAFRKDIPEARAGMNVGLLLRGLKRDEVRRGQVLSAPGVIKPFSRGKAQIFVLTKEEGGRHTPFFNGYKPQFYFRTTDVTGSVQLLGGAEMCMPGDNITMKIDLGDKPIAMEEGVRFAVREGGRTVGAGVVTKVVE